MILDYEQILKEVSENIEEEEELTITHLHRLLFHLLIHR